MRIEISENGYLWLERAGTMKRQDCHYRDARCGDWCPLFGEPEQTRYGSTIVHLGCGYHTYIEGTITDKRKRPEMENG